MKFFSGRQTTILMLFLIHLTSANAGENHSHSSVEVAPAHEHQIALDKKLTGPTKSQGISSVTALGALDLGNDFPSMAGQQFRAREITIEPGGVVAVHEHDSRPGVAYILEGEVIEHRSDQKDPIQHKKGSVAFENSGVSHWWENKSNAIVKALVVDILPKK